LKGKPTAFSFPFFWHRGSLHQYHTINPNLCVREKEEGDKDLQPNRQGLNFDALSSLTLTWFGFQVLDSFYHGTEVHWTASDLITSILQTENRFILLWHKFETLMNDVILLVS